VPRLLHQRLAARERCALPLLLVAQGPLEGADRVEVLHLDLDTQRVLRPVRSDDGVAQQSLLHRTSDSQGLGRRSQLGE
jgi:hypothetical protein